MLATTASGQSGRASNASSRRRRCSSRRCAACSRRSSDWSDRRAPSRSGEFHRRSSNGDLTLFTRRSHHVGGQLACPPRKGGSIPSATQSAARSRAASRPASPDRPPAEAPRPGSVSSRAFRSTSGFRGSPLSAPCALPDRRRRRLRRHPLGSPSSVQARRPEYPALLASASSRSRLLLADAGGPLLQPVPPRARDCPVYRVDNARVRTKGNGATSRNRGCGRRQAEGGPPSPLSPHRRPHLHPAARTLESAATRRRRRMERGMWRRPRVPANIRITPDGYSHALPDMQEPAAEPVASVVAAALGSA